MDQIKLHNHTPQIFRLMCSISSWMAAWLTGLEDVCPNNPSARSFRAPRGRSRWSQERCISALHCYTGLEASHMFSSSGGCSVGWWWWQGSSDRHVFIPVLAKDCVSCFANPLCSSISHQDHKRPSDPHGWCSLFLSNNEQSLNCSGISVLLLCILVR